MLISITIVGITIKLIFRSGIPRIPASMINKKRQEDSWSEGCF